MIRRAWPQKRPPAPRRRDASSGLVVLICAAVLGLAGIFYLAAGIASAL